MFEEKMGELWAQMFEISYSARLAQVCCLQLYTLSTRKNDAA